MKIEVFGPGCDRCDALEANARLAASELGLKAEFVKVRELDKMIEAGVLLTPAIAIDGQIRGIGRVYSAEEIKAWLTAAKPGAG